MEGNRGLSWKEDGQYKINHVERRVENCFYYGRCRTDMDIKKYKSTMHVELSNWFILLHWEMKAKKYAEEASSHNILWPLVNTPGRPFVPIRDI